MPFLLKPEVDTGHCTPEKIRWTHGVVHYKSLQYIVINLI